MKELLPISEVFSQIKDSHTKKSSITLRSGQVVRLSNNLIWLHKKKDLTCSDCGCCGTHLQRFNDNGREIWRVMTYSRFADRPSFLNLDHVIPRSRGGKWTEDNLRVTCEFCNVARSDAPIVREAPEGETIYTLNKIVNVLFNCLHSKIKNCEARLMTFKNTVKNKLREFGWNAKRILRSQLDQILPDACVAVGLTLNPALREAIDSTAV